jgi:hypothetical protein
MHCSFSKTTDETSFIGEELGISLSSLNVTVSNWLTVGPERKGLQQQNIGR